MARQPKGLPAHPHPALNLEDVGRVATVSMTGAPSPRCCCRHARTQMRDRGLRGCHEAERTHEGRRLVVVVDRALPVPDANTVGALELPADSPRAREIRRSIA